MEVLLYAWQGEVLDHLDILGLDLLLLAEFILA
jgi:hypothetical protein